jgi:hypothetical protein
LADVEPLSHALVPRRLLNSGQISVLVKLNLAKFRIGTAVPIGGGEACSKIARQIESGVLTPPGGLGNGFWPIRDPNLIGPEVYPF